MWPSCSATVQLAEIRPAQGISGLCVVYRPDDLVRRLALAPAVYHLSDRQWLRYRTGGEDQGERARRKAALRQMAEEGMKEKSAEFKKVGELYVPQSSEA